MTMFLAPYTAIADIDGSPLDAGFIFFGEFGKNPESFPISVYWDADFAIPAAQPIRTRNGYPIRNGSPCKIYLKQAEHSLVIKNKNLSAILVEMNNKGISSSLLVRPNGDTVETSLTNIDAELNDKQQQIDEKPSQQYVDEKLDLKAPQETTYTKLEVDSALSAKAPQETTYTKLETDVKFSAYVGGRKGFTTLALAQAGQSTLTANTVVDVTNDPDPAKNGTYQWNGTTLTKSAYDPLTQAKADATTKANTAEANAKSYTDTVAELELLPGLDIYYKAQENPSTLFQAIWQEYNKPVWYIGNATFVDTTGATLQLYEQELLFTIKLTEANQTFIYPTRPTGTQIIDATIDWGDGIVTSHTNYSISHTYIGSIGDEFQIKLKGVMPEFDFGAGNAGRRTSQLMLKSVDKNTMPKVMTVFDLAGCTNLVYLCRGAYSSWDNGATFSPRYAENSPDITFHPKAFEGLESVTNISGIFGRLGYSINFNIPAGLLDVFANATIASYAFYGLAKPLPVGILDKLINLEDVSYMFNTASITSIDNRIFKNQTKLKNVSNCFRLASSLVADAFQLYTDMNQGGPTTVNGCFANVNSMTNLTSVPAGWKA